MAASNDEEMDSLLSSFDLIYQVTLLIHYMYIYIERERYLLGNYHWHCDQDFKSGIAEIELLKSNCNAEVRKREALQITCHALKQGLLLSFAISSSYFLYCFVFVRLPQRNK